MRIENRNDALEWLNAWGEKLRPAILKSAIEGMRACYGSAWIAGHEIEAAGYAEAYSVLSAGRVEYPLHEGVRHE